MSIDLSSHTSFLFYSISFVKARRLKIERNVSPHTDIPFNAVQLSQYEEQRFYFAVFLCAVLYVVVCLQQMFCYLCCTTFAGHVYLSLIHKTGFVCCERKTFFFCVSNNGKSFQCSELCFVVFGTFCWFFFALKNRQHQRTLTVSAHTYLYFVREASTYFSDRILNVVGFLFWIC